MNSKIEMYRFSNFDVWLYILSNNFILKPVTFTYHLLTYVTTIRYNFFIILVVTLLIFFLNLIRFRNIILICWWHYSLEHTIFSLQSHIIVNRVPLSRRSILICRETLCLSRKNHARIRFIKPVFFLINKSTKRS